DRVVTERFAGEIFDAGMRVFGEEKSYRGMARRAAVGVGGRFAQIRGHFLNEIDGGRAAQNARRDAAAKWRVNQLPRPTPIAPPPLRWASTLPSCSKRQTLMGGTILASLALSRSRGTL